MTAVDAARPAEPVLHVEGLSVELPTSGSWDRVVDDVWLTVHAGETVGLVGESGSGKTMTTLAITGLTPRGARVQGSARLGGRELVGLSEEGLRQVRGREVGMIFQEPRRSLNPAFTVGEQVAEVVRRHRRLSRRDAWARAVELLDLMAIPDARRRAREYPYQFSGGMCQRVMLAIAVACEPKLLIADEPTTALDVTVQKQMLKLIAGLQVDLGLAVLFVTHDLGVIAEVCHRAAVMYAGTVVESGPVAEMFSAPQHPYTEGLLGAVPGLHHRRERFVAIPGSVPRRGHFPTGCRFHPRCPYVVEGLCTTGPDPVRTGPEGREVRCHRSTELALAGVGAEARAQPADDAGDRSAPGTEPVFEVRGLAKSFVVRRNLVGAPARVIDAVKGVDLTLGPHETLAVVGESGAGKSTVGRLALRLDHPDQGTVCVLGIDLSSADRSALRAFRRGATMVFQDPYTSFDPRVLVGASVGEPLAVHFGFRAARQRQRVAELLERVGLDAFHAHRYPSELSGGELQRAAIARALATDPQLIVCDEPVAALDMSVRAQVLNLLRDLQSDLGLSYLFISHDLALVRVLAHRVAVMRSGEIVECADVDTLFRSPSHPYTQTLLAAIPSPDPVRPRLGVRAPAPPTARMNVK